MKALPYAYHLGWLAVAQLPSSIHAFQASHLRPTSLVTALQATAKGTSTTSEDPWSFSVGVLGDLHIDPRKMEDYETGRDQWLKVFEQERQRTPNVALVSLGDLGESKNCDHNEMNPSELFAGTTLCHEIAADYLSSFDGIYHEVIGGNHDLLKICLRY